MTSTQMTSTQATTTMIEPGDSAALIGRRLLATGAIASSSRFELLVLLLGWEQRLAPGEYTFEPNLPTVEILRRIHSGETSPLRVALPEGLRVEQVTERLAEAGIADPDRLTEALAAASAGLSAGLPAGLGGRSGELAAFRPAGASLEGYLFPSTYAFPLDAAPDEIVKLMLRRLDEAVSDSLQAQIAASGRSLHEILTIASIIEREAYRDDERALISAVIWNRLAAGMPLQMNSTVQYAVGRAGGWWKAELSDADLSVDSPYNSYRYDGLPPTPICSPGLASIEAAASPADAPYRFFVAKGDGSHAFAVTFAEHQVNVERYLGGSE